MYKAFKLDGNKLLEYIENPHMETIDDFLDYKAMGKLIFEDSRKKIKSNFEEHYGVIDGAKLSNDWFPQVEADVFISHSHKDYNVALGLAGILSNVGLTPFIDSCVWGYANDLLKSIDKKYCKANNSMYDYSKHNHSMYDYNKRNHSTSHVHMMLTIALIKMIYNTECLIFLDTPNLIYPKDDIPTDNMDATLSPWIYAEMEMTNLLTQRTLEEHRKKEEFLENLTIVHTAKTKNIEPLQISDLIKWSKENYESKEAALDALYYIQQNSKKIMD
ncbi:toll/interleukin-1 receptor domain-containing protein [bacterium]|nr:toll/interleukin-1 receptor domain-containing protein [bacterium]